MTIKELLVGAQFESIVFYLNEQGFTSPLELAGFDFDELLFVPGVSEEAIEQCKAILCNYSEPERPNDTLHSIETDSNADNTATKESTENIQSNSSDFFAELSELPGQIAAAALEVQTRDRLDQFRAAFLGTPALNEQYDYEIFSLLCDEIDSLLPIPEENAGVKQFSPEECERLSSVSVRDVFGGIPRGGAMIRVCLDNGICTLLDLENVDFDAIRPKGVGPTSLSAFRNAYLSARDAVLAKNGFVRDIEKTPLQWFVDALSSIKDRNRDCLIARAQGQTLQDVGDKYNLSRERVRQITKHAIRRLRGPCEAIIMQLIAGRICINALDIKHQFNEQSLVDVIAFVLEDVRSVKYFPFANKYVLAEIVPNNCPDLLKSIAQDIIGNSINYYENLELIDEQLASLGLSFIDSIDYIGYLLENGYKAFGDFVVKKDQTYKNICLDVIRRHFQDGIKLDNDENNTDMARLRSIVHREFGDVGLPSNNRALTARVSPALILCGRGKYISPENAVIDLPLIEEIVAYINASKESSFYYAELFSAFSGQLLARTVIDNCNYLHGVLKTLYPDEFKYERDLLVKTGMERVPFEKRLSQLLKNNRCAMTRAEIQNRMLGVSDIRIVNALLRLPEIIQWDYNEFNHMDNIHFSDEDIRTLEESLLEIMANQSGYCSERQLYSAVMKKMPQFIKANQIKNYHNLFYVANYLLGDKFRFSRPHIASSKFPNVELTNVSVVRFFVGPSKTITYPDLVELSNRIGLPNGAFTMVLNDVEKDYCRISLNDYILNSDFHISADAQSKISSVLADLTAASGYYGIFALYNYDSFPQVEFEWNEFLLQTIMEKYDLGYKLLEPNTKDRRYKRGIIVPDICSCNSFEEFVIEQLKKDSIQAMPETEFSSYLRRKGLVLTTNIPQELYEGDGVRLENGTFIYD